MAEQRRLKCHVFVCTNLRDPKEPRGSCAAKGSEEILKALKKEAQSSGLVNGIRIQKSGCLDVCEKGPAAVVYPEGVWYGELKVDDLPELVKEHLVLGRPVEKRRI